MHLYERVLSKIMCRCLCKTVRFKINFPFFSFSYFCLGCLENIKLGLLITFNADRNTFLADKIVRLVSGLYVLIDARNKISKLFIAL